MNNPPAFPVPFPESGHFNEGMSLRDYFAGQAVVGQLSNVINNKCTAEEFAEAAYATADAMLDAWNSSYDPTVSDRYMSNLTKAGARGSMVHPKVEAEWDGAYAPELEQADEPSGVWGWIITGMAVFVMGVTIALQI